MIHQRLPLHPKWKPATQLYYNKYHTVLRVATTSSHWTTKKNNLCIPDRFEGAYKLVVRFDWASYWEVNDEESARDLKKEYITLNSVYTNNHELIDYLLSLDSTNPVAEIISPSSDQHFEYLSDPDRTYVYRNHLWYKKYAHKTKISIKRELRYSTTQESIENSTQQIYNVFDPETSHWPAKYAPHYYHFRSRWSSIIVYTNDEPAIMLFKMVTGDLFNIHIETAITEENV